MKKITNMCRKVCRREVHGPGAGCTAGPAGTLGPLHGFRAAARHPPVADPTARAFEALQVPSEM